MIIYLVCYIVIGFFLYDFEHRKHPKYILTFCILLLSLLAGFRNVSIGTDVRIYANNVYLVAEQVTNVKELIDFLFNSSFHTINEVESGYLLIAFIGTKIFGGLFGTLFLTSIIINAGVIIGLYRIKEHLSFNIAVMIYCFMFYQHTYNMMRQWMAIAVIIFGIKYIYEREFLKYCVLIIIAMMFHSTALIGLGLYVVAVYLDSPKSVQRQVILIAVVVFGILFFKQIVRFLVSYGIMTSKYLKYAEGNDVSIFLPELIIRIPSIALCGVLYSSMKKNDKYHAYWFTIMLIETAISQLHSVMDYATRIGAYLYAGQIIEMSMACKLEGIKHRMISKSLVILYVVLYWLVMYIYFGYSDTYPYASSILGIG